MKAILRILDAVSGWAVVLLLAGMQAVLVGILLGILWPPAGVIGGILAFFTGLKPLNEWEKHHHG